MYQNVEILNRWSLRWVIPRPGNHFSKRKNLFEFNDIVETLGGNIKHGYNITRAKTRAYKIIMPFNYSCPLVFIIMML